MCPIGPTAASGQAATSAIATAELTTVEREQNYSYDREQRRYCCHCYFHCFRHYWLHWRRVYQVPKRGGVWRRRHARDTKQQGGLLARDQSHH